MYNNIYIYYVYQVYIHCAKFKKESCQRYKYYSHVYIYQTNKITFYQAMCRK